MLEIITLPFFQRALIVGLILGGLMSILGVLVVLRKMSFFSDAIGHSALAGIAIALLLSINPFWGALIFTLFVALAISGVRSVSKLSLDTLLGVFFSASVALGVILVTLTPGYQADLISFLFGNILTVTQTDVVTSIIVAILVLGAFFWIGKSLVAISFDVSLAKTEGIPVKRYELFFLLLLAATIALSIKFVGVILVTALLVIPAATAQNLANSLSHMFAISLIVSVISVVVGMLASASLATPSGPTIILAGACIFALSVVKKVVTA